MMTFIKRAIVCCILCTAFWVRAGVSGTPASWQEKLLGSKLVFPDKREVGTTEHLKGKMVALYCSSDGCGFCRRFNPHLRKFYRSLQKSGAPFEIVLISMDETPAGMRKMIVNEDMIWPAMPFHYGRSNKISNKYKAYGVPVLIVLDADGEVISRDGRNAVEREGRLAYYAWRMGMPPISDMLFKFVPSQYDLGNPKLLAFKIAKLAILILIVICVARGIKIIFCNCRTSDKSSGKSAR